MLHISHLRMLCEGGFLPVVGWDRGLIEFRRNNGKQWEVVESGAVSLPRDATWFQLSYQDLRYSFAFAKIEGEKQGIRVDANDGKSIAFTVVNFDQQLGTAWESPVGNINGRELHLSLYILVIKTDDEAVRPRLIAYTFSMENV